MDRTVSIAAARLLDCVRATEFGTDGRPATGNIGRLSCGE